MTYSVLVGRISCAVSAIIIYGLIAVSYCAALSVSEAQAQDLNSASSGAERSDASGDSNIEDLDAIVDPNQDQTETEFVVRSDDSLLIAALVVDGEILDEGFLLYVENDELIIPLGMLSELLGFQITTDPLKGTASGWFVREENTLEISKPYTHVTFAGQRIPLRKVDIIENHEDDIYINKSFIEQLFPITLTFNFNELKLDLKTTEALPFQAQSARHEKWEKARKQKKGANLGLELDDSVIRLKHRKFAPPSIAVDQNLAVTETAGARTTSSAHNVSLQGDMFGMDMRSSFGLNTSTTGTNEIQNTRFTLSRTDIEGNLLGRLHATEYEFGDATSYAFPLAPGGQRGRGFKLSNRPSNFVRDASDFFIEGFGPIGWDVEIYQDDRLLDFRVIDNDGRYRFDELALREGFNLFRIVLYGPNGEKRETFERFYLGQNMVEKGKFIYEASALQSSSPLLDLRDQKAEETDPTLSFIGEYGINNNLSASLGYFHGPFAGSTLTGIGAGVRASGNSTFAQLNTFRSSEGETSIQANVTGNLSKNITWSAGHTQHMGYDANERSIEQETFINFAQKISSELFPDGNYSFGIEREVTDTGITRTILDNRVSAKFFGFNFANELEYTIHSNTTDEFLGTLTVRRRLPIGNFRAKMDYRLQNDKGVDSIELQFNNKLSQKVFLNTVLNNTFGNSKETRLTSGLDIRLEKYRVGFDTSINDKGDFQAGMNLSYNFVPTSLKGDYIMSGSGSDLSNGRLIINPFLDANQNNIRDEDEEVLSGVVFRNALRGTKGASDENGNLVLSGITPNTINRVILDEKSLPDIFMKASSTKLKILGKQGVNGPIEIPIYQLGEATGTLTYYDPDRDEEWPLERVRILLLSENGETVAETVTEFDGFYVFPSLPLGTYKMFFPKTNALNIRYTGEGTGPSFTITAEEPELWDGDLFMSPRRIDFRSNFTEDELQEAPKPLENKQKLGFMGLKTDPQSPQKQEETAP